MAIVNFMEIHEADRYEFVQEFKLRPAMELEGSLTPDGVCEYVASKRREHVNGSVLEFEDSTPGIVAQHIEAFERKGWNITIVSPIALYVRWSR